MADINPYRAPQATVLELPSTDGRLADEPNVVDVGRGLVWLGEGWQLFRRAALVWIAICVLTFVAIGVLSTVPIIGQLATTLLTVLLAGGLMIGCRDLDRGQDLTVQHMLAGAQKHLQPLVTIGALYLVGIFVTIVAAGLTLGGSMLGVLAGSVQAEIAATTLVLALLLIGGMLIPLGAAVWFAPALATLHELSPVDAMKASFRGCLKNWLAFLVYGVIVFILTMIATIPVGLGWLLLMPVLAGSVYAAYKDIFLQS
jgi:uncharacterized membrane protein